MRITKRQLKKIIREEYSRLKRQGLIRESGVMTGGPGSADTGSFDDAEYELAQQEDMMTVDHVSDMLEDEGEALVDRDLAEEWYEDNHKYYPGITIEPGYMGDMSMILWPAWRESDMY